METKHTQGEWKVVTTDPHLVPECSRIQIESYRCPGWICKVQTDGVIEQKEGIANAKLIAAAPELLEACLKAINIVELWAPTYSEKELNESHIGELAALSMMRQKLEQAINKATK